MSQVDEFEEQRKAFKKNPQTKYTPNPTGLYPVEFKVLIRLDPTEEKTSGGVYIPGDRLDRDQMAETKATLIEVGGNAFEDWNDPKPVKGDRVLISKYSGQTPKPGDIEDLYRLCNDKDIIAIVR